VKYHPHDRLDRSLVGQGLGRVRPGMVRLLGRREFEIKRLVEVSTPREPRGSKVRNLYPSSQPAPNAPQLIRLLRHPFALEKGYFQRQSAPLRGAELRPERRGFREEVEDILHSSRRVESIRPTEIRTRLESRTRPSIDEWLSVMEQE
jgi:hypothetical protein